MGVPTRSEMDAAHRRITELERQLRRVMARMGEVAVAPNGSSSPEKSARNASDAKASKGATSAPATAKAAANKPVARKAVAKKAPAKKVATKKLAAKPIAKKPGATKVVKKQPAVRSTPAATRRGGKA